MKYAMILIAVTFLLELSGCIVPVPAGPDESDRARKLEYEPAPKGELPP
jgi:hypothetical protein